MLLSSWISRVLRLPSRPCRRQRRAWRRETPLPFRPRLELLEDRLVPAASSIINNPIITVTTTADDPAAPIAGQTTLRDAINQANANPGSTIDFDLSTSGPGYQNGIWTIQPTAALPVSTAPVVIDATSQPGYNGFPVVVLSGLNAGSGVVGLVITGGKSTVKGLVIQQFSSDGIDLTTNGGDVIEGDYIGTGPTGTNAAGNGGNGVRIAKGAGNNTLRNDWIAHNTAAGVAVVGAASFQNSILGSSINHNTGGGITNSSGGVTVSSCTLTGNSAGSGGSIYNHAGTMTVSNCTLSSNSAVNQGGALYNDGIITISNSNFTGNSAGDGDDIYNNGSLTVQYGSAGFNGTLAMGNAAVGTATFTDAGNFNGNLTVNNPGNLQSLSVAGTITKGSSISVAGTLNNSTIGTNSGTLSAGSISNMKVTTNSIAGNILASSIAGLSATENDGIISVAGSGAASNVSIFVNKGTFEAGESSNPDAGAMTNTAIGTNSGLVSAGAISGMAVILNNSNGRILAGSISGLIIQRNAGIIKASGQGTTSNVTIGTNSGTGTFAAVEDSTSGSGTMSSTTVGTNAGTISAGSISTMSVSTNSGAISAAGQGTTSHVTINKNKGTLIAQEDSTSGSGTMSDTVIGTNSGMVSAGSIATMSVNTNSGNINATNQGADITMGTLGATGTFTVVGTLTNLNVTVFNGLVAAGHIDQITVTHAPGASQMLNIVEGGVSRQLLLAGGALPQSVSYVYDHNASSGDAQLTMSVNDGPNYPASNSYDIELLSSSAAPGSGFDLAALYNVGSTPAHVRNVLIEGNLVPSAGDASQVGSSSNVGGVQLPGTALASVGIMGNAPAGSVVAASVEAVSFASLNEGKYGTAVATAAPDDDGWGDEDGLPPGEHPATAWDAARLLAPGTAIVQANNTFLAAAGQTAQGQNQPVALFLDTRPTGKDEDDASGSFDPRSVLIGNEGNVIGATSPVLAQITVTTPPDTDDKGQGTDGDERSIIQAINLIGPGGSLQTSQEIASAITSNKPLGDLVLQGEQGLEANITAPSIFGNIIVPDGPISGTIQTTSGDIGRTLTGNGRTVRVTSIVSSGDLTGQILSAGNLLSQISVDGGFSGVIAAGGNLGFLQETSSGAVSRLGGLSVNGGASGDVVILGNIYGDLYINGGLKGRIAAQGAPNVLGAGRQGILGNIDINGGVSSKGAIVSGGEIGDAGLDTDLDIHGAVKGILAAVGPLFYEIHGSTKFAFIFNNVGNPNSPQYAGGANQAAIDAIFSGLTIGDLTALLLNLNKLHVSNGNLSDS